MRSIITTNISSSTVTSPLKFFEKFYTKQALQLAFESFLNQMPNLNDPDSEWHKFPLSIDVENKKWSVEYQVEISYDEHSGPTYESLIREYTFETELLNLIKEEFFISKEILKKKIIDSTGDKRKKDLARTFIYKCLGILDSLNLNEFNQFTEFLSRPIRSLVRFLYVNFYSIAPDQKIDKRIGEILKERESSRDIYESTGLHPDLAIEVLKIKDNHGYSVVTYEDVTDLEKLKIFLMQDFNAIKGSPIRLHGAVGIVSYFLVEIITISGLQLKEVQKQKMFKINGDDFYSNYASTEKYRISFRNESLMFQIDSVISAHAI